MSKHIPDPIDAAYDALERIESDSEPQLCAGCWQPLTIPLIATCYGPVYHEACLAMALMGMFDTEADGWVN